MLFPSCTSWANVAVIIRLPQNLIALHCVVMVIELCKVYGRGLNWTRASVAGCDVLAVRSPRLFRFLDYMVLAPVHGQP